MTPPASSAAVAAPRARRRRPSEGHGAAPHRGTTAPRVTRRVSGPAGGAHALPRPVGVPAVGARLRSLPDHRFIDRLLRGRVWIPFVAFFLCGIVATQVHLLKLNAGISRAVEKSSALQRENAALRASIGRLSSGERLDAVANRLGLVDPPAGSVRFLRSRPGDAGKAAKAMSKPDPAGGTTAAATTSAPTATPAATAATTSSAAVTAPTTTGTSTAGTTGTTGTPGTTGTTSTTGTSATTPAITPATTPTTGTVTPTASTGAAVAPASATAPGVTR